MNIPFLDVSASHHELREEIEYALLNAARSGQYIGGAEVASFESEFATYVDAKHCIGVGNGLDALHIGLIALGVAPGDEVIVPSNTFIATWLAVTRCGATPVPVEPDLDTYNISAKSVERAITPRTKAIIPVHLYGNPADLGPLVELAMAHGLRILEDAAQAHGARYRGKRIGSHGDAVAWSFYPGKNLGALGDAGALTTNNPDYAERMRRLRNYGSKTKYFHDEIGFNSRLDPLQAAALRVKLRYLDEWNARRTRVAIAYTKAIARLDGLVAPVQHDWAEPSWHLYVVRSPRRDALAEHLHSAGIATQIHYPLPPHLQAAYSHLGYKRGDFPVAERMSNEVLSLPIGPHLNEASVESVIQRL